jgi:aspartyl-tRNA(Asn)/glutamyl-tRNA(Gln) amidotransferase subunit C
MSEPAEGSPAPEGSGAAPLSRRDVERVAQLARLELSEDELERFTRQLASVLDYAREVAALDLADRAPTAHPLPLRNVLRPDEQRPSLDRDEVLAEAPEVEAHRFKVPRIGEPP